MTFIERWTALATDVEGLSNGQGRPIAIIWRDGLGWRVSATDDPGPGEPKPTLDQAMAAARIIARSRLALLCDCPPGRVHADADGRCFTCSGAFSAEPAHA